MSKSISLTIPDDKYVIVKHEASSKGLTPSEFVRLALFSYINKYPSRGVFAELDKIPGK